MPSSFASAIVRVARLATRQLRDVLNRFVRFPAERGPSPKLFAARAQNVFHCLFSVNPTIEKRTDVPV
jgi:hypothetical protein